MSKIPPRKSNRKIKLNSKYKDNNEHDPECVYCTECNMIIDNVILEHCIFEGRDVCNLCYVKLSKPPTNTHKSNINFFSNPPNIPIIPNTPPNKSNNPSFRFTQPPQQPPQQPPHIQPNLFQTDNNPTKIRLIFFNSNPNVNNTANKNIDTEKQTKDKESKDKESKDKEPKDKKTKDKETKGKESKNKKHKSNRDHDNNNNYTTGNNEEDDNDEHNSPIGNLFIQSLINRLHNCDNSSNIPNNNIINNNNSDEDDEEDEDNMEEPIEYEWLGSNIKNIDDLIELGKSYHSRKRKRHNLNLKLLNRLVEPLTELKNMIGMQDVKKIVFDQIIYYLQQLDDKNVDMLHTVIVGPPGVGKTQLTHIIAKIYNRLGFLKTDKVICAKRDDLIGEYIGQTAPKTRKVLEKALGGVLLLDEIYSLSPTSDRDFAKEAIDMINMYLSEHAHDLVCVVAGYKKPTYEKFFSQNEGLARRFTHHFEIKGYSAEELTLIFKKYLEEQKWFLNSSIEELSPIIKENMEIFPNFGGDMTTLFACCKKTHSRRLLNISSEEELQNTKKKIMLPDIIAGIKLFRDIKEKHSSNDEEDKAKYMHMYS